MDDTSGHDLDDRRRPFARPLPVRRVRLITALFADFDSAMRTARGLVDRGYDRDKITIILSPPPRSGQDLEIRPEFWEPELVADGPPLRDAGRPHGETRRLDDSLEDAYLILGIEAATDSERVELEEHLRDFGGRLIQEAAVPPEDSVRADSRRLDSFGPIRDELQKQASEEEGAGD